MCGGSYFGNTQWMAAMSKPPEQKCSALDWIRPLRQAGRPGRVHLPVSRRLDRRLAGPARLTDITQFGQDWGGFIFLVHVGRTPDRFAAMVAANTGLAAPDVAPVTARPCWNALHEETDRFIVSGNRSVSHVEACRDSNQGRQRLRRRRRPGYRQGAGRRHHTRWVKSQRSAELEAMYAQLKKYVRRRPESELMRGRTPTTGAHGGSSSRGPRSKSMSMG